MQMLQMIHGHSMCTGIFIKSWHTDPANKAWTQCVYGHGHCHQILAYILWHADAADGCTDTAWGQAFSSDLSMQMLQMGAWTQHVHGQGQSQQTLAYRYYT